MSHLEICSGQEFVTFSDLDIKLIEIYPTSNERAHQKLHFGEFPCYDNFNFINT